VLILPFLLSKSLLISKMDLRETGGQGGKLIELAQDRVQRWAVFLAVFKRRLLLPER
jgi:hypothetical protein